MRVSQRYLLRSIALILAITVCFIPWGWLTLLPAALSPLLSLGGSIAARQWSFIVLFGMPIFLLALLRGRWFCAHLCPMGFCVELAGRMNPRAHKRFLHWPHFGRPLALLCIGGALLGYPWVIWLDPLSIFSGFFGIWHRPVFWWSLLPGLGFLLIILSSIMAPNAWCYRLCPLGATQDLLGLLGTRIRGHHHSASHNLLEAAHPAVRRRTFLFALLGGTGALTMRHYLPAAAPLPIRPPGAREETAFTGLCARCGHCMRSCPNRIIQPDLGHSGLAGLLTPVLNFSENYCDEWCNDCAKACPTSAIERVSMEEKRNLSLGTAQVNKSLCLAWKDGKACMVCQEFCPYLAVKLVEHRGVHCPEVDPEQCRGCGACQLNCPAMPQKAIVVRGSIQKPARSIMS
jgi:ferredoxin-type protein NapF